MMSLERMVMSALTVVLGAMTPSGPANTQPPAAQAVYRGRIAEAAQRGVESHPEIRQALRSLVAARIRLEQADHDFHGHRAKALELTNRATDELHKALRSDRR